MRKSSRKFERAAACLIGTACGFVSLVPAEAAPEVYSGYVSRQQVDKLTCDVHWFNNLKKAEEAAQEQGKLIFWVHMVGKIDGAT